MTNFSTKNCRILHNNLLKKSVLCVIAFFILYFIFWNKFDLMKKSPLSSKKAEIVSTNHWDKDEFVGEIDHSIVNNEVKIAIFDQHQEGICLFSINNLFLDVLRMFEILNKIRLQGIHNSQKTSFSHL